MTDSKLLLRKLFFSLHMLPWLLSIFCLFVLLFFVYIDNLHLRSTNSALLSFNSSMVFTNGYDNGKRSVYLDAVDNGYGEWYISDNLSIDFRWLDLDMIKSKITEDEVFSRSSNMSNISDNVFSSSNYELSVRLGIDLEGDLGVGILSLLDNYRSRNVLIISDSDYRNLRSDILGYINARFIGFKTYNNIK